MKYTNYMSVDVKGIWNCLVSRASNSKLQGHEFDSQSWQRNFSPGVGLCADFIDSERYCRCVLSPG